MSFPEVDCPRCGKRFSAHTAVCREVGPAPEPGSVSVCPNCFVVLVFTESMELRLVRRGELTVAMQRRVFKVQRALIEFKAMKN